MPHLLRRVPVWPALLLTLLLTACSDEVAAPTAPPADDPEPTIPPTVLVTPSPEAAGEVATDDPVEFVLEFNELVQDGDWDAVRPMVVAEFREFDDEVFRVHLPRAFPAEHDGEPVEWQVEEHGLFTVVRISQLPVFAIVLRETDDGWLVDPGQYPLAVAELQSEGATSWGLPSRRSISFEREGLASDKLIPLTRVTQNNFDQIAIDGDQVSLTMTWTFSQGAEGEILLDDVSWSAGGKSGPVDVTWATAVIENGAIAFPALGDPGPGQSTAYRVTFLLDGVPDSDTFQLHMGDIRVAVPDEESISFGITYDIPLEEFPQALGDDVPDAGGTPAGQELEPADPPTISVVQFETTVDDGLTAVLIELQTDPLERVELVSDPEVVWSDGEVTGAGQPGGEAIFVRAERQDVPDGVEPVEVLIPHLSRELPADPDATFHPNRIETRWGTFFLGELVEQQGGGWSADYRGAGTRTLSTVIAGSDDEEVTGLGTSANYEADFTVSQARIDFPPGFDAFRDQLPLPVEVVVRDIAEDVVVDLDR